MSRGPTSHPVQENHPFPYDPGKSSFQSFKDTQLSDDDEPFVITFVYDFAVIYNLESETSRRYALTMTECLEGAGLQGYLAHRDGANANKLQELIDTIRRSKYILILFDKDFNKNNFNLYAQETAFKEVLDAGQLSRFVPVVIGVPRKTVPRYIPNFCLEFPTDNIRNETTKVARLERTLRAEIVSTQSYFGMMNMKG